MAARSAKLQGCVMQIFSLIADVVRIRERHAEATYGAPCKAMAASGSGHGVGGWERGRVGAKAKVQVVDLCSSDGDE